MVLGVAMLAFVPLFFFASEYAQISLNDTRHRRQVCTSCTSLSALRFPRRSAGECSIGLGQSVRSCLDAQLPQWDWACGLARSRNSHSVLRSGTSLSLELGWE